MRQPPRCRLTTRRCLDFRVVVPVQPRRYLVRTFGCQMNEHDSERIAGLLEEDGMVPAAGVDDADVIVLNTCCIRENADNKLYGNLGHLKTLKDRRPDLQIAVGGCLAQKDRDSIQRRAPWVDAVWGTHNVGRAAQLLSEARSDGAPTTEILDAAPLDDDEFVSALPVRDASSGRPGSPSRSAATTSVLSASCLGTGPGDQPAVRADRLRGRGAGSGRHRRGDPARSERQLLRTGPHDPPAQLSRLARTAAEWPDGSGPRPTGPGPGLSSPI